MTQVDTSTRRQVAEQRLLVIRNALEVADEELERAFVERDWEALEFDSWVAYCAAIPEYRNFKMKTAPRRERIKKILEANGSIREAAAAAGTSVGTAHNDARVLGFVQERSELNTPAVYPEAINPAKPAKAAVPASRLPVWATAAMRVQTAGARGLTCLELEHELGWGHGAASAALHGAERKGRIRRDGRFRDRYGTYVAT